MKIKIYSTLSGLYLGRQQSELGNICDVPQPWEEYLTIFLRSLSLLLCIIIQPDGVLYSLLADCVIAYINTKLCDCMSMTYKRQIKCRQPEIYGGKDCPEECESGRVIAGSISCSWDDLDAMKCNAERVKPLSMITAMILIYTRYLFEGRLT